MFAFSNTLEVKGTTYDVVTNTRKVWHTTTTNKHNGVLLEVVTFTTNVSPNFLTVGQANTSNFTKCRVRLFRGFSGYLDTNTAL